MNTAAINTSAATIPEAAVGGGYAVLQRNPGGRLVAPHSPYEHPTIKSAKDEAMRRAGLRPGRTFVAVKVMSEFVAEETAEATEGAPGGAAREANAD